MKAHALASLVALGLGACGAGHSTRPAQPPDATATSLVVPDSIAATDGLSAAKKLVAEKKWPEALGKLRSVIERKGFSGLPTDVQYAALSSAARVAIGHGQPDLGYEYLGRITAMPQATYGDWLERLRVAQKLEMDGDSVSGLTVVMQRWPEHQGELNPEYVLKAVNDARRLGSGAALPLLQSLYDAHWRLKWDIEPSAVWRDLALLQLEKHRLIEAKKVASHVTDVYVLIAMHSDRRFDEVVAGNSTLADIEAAADREFQAFQTLAEKNPQSLELKSWVIEFLLRRQHYEGALAASDSILVDIRSTNYPEKLFQDFTDERAWFLDLRATALSRVGRSDEAVAQLSAASILPERNGGGNVNQIINLADLYCYLGRPQDALSAIGRLTAPTSPYGAMQLEWVRADAAYQMGDSKQVQRSLQYMHDHRADAAGAYKDALLSVNQLEPAAHELVAELKSTGERNEALVSVQSFAPSPGTPREMSLEVQRRAMIARPEVQAEIRRVGRVEAYPLESPWQ